ncbi:MAG: hypothetical protein WAK20_17205 [Candidatus Acidiferrum sp.]
MYRKIVDKLILQERNPDSEQVYKTVGIVAEFAGIIGSGMIIGINHARAHDDDDDRDEARTRRGFDIAPVPLDCNGCHSAGPQTEYASGGNPYFGQPAKASPATYWGGGSDPVNSRRKVTIS